jgi:N-acetylmuramoyl-L-alanine amidase
VSEAQGKERKMISKGDEGSAVTHFQQCLLRWDPECLPKYGADGDYGSESVSAVTKFQEAHGLTATGSIDGVTAALLGAQVPA